MHENREIPQGSAKAEGAGKACGHKPVPYACGKSDPAIVPVKGPNEPGHSGKEAAEGRAGTRRNPQQPTTGETQSSVEVSSGLERIREAANRDKRQRFTALLHHVTPELLRTSYLSLKRDAATGTDEQTWQEYGQGLEERVKDLHDRVQSGRYKAKPSKRIWIPKADGRLRPIGIAALEDKIVQHACVRILNQIYETDFLGFSYGFRPGRSQHNALDALSVALTQCKVSWVLDADIRSFFDTLDHGWVMKFLEHRVADRRLLRLVAKWLRAGVSEEGKWSRTTVGTPQGAVISPLLANIYLHYVLDLWARRWRQREARGEVVIIRYADDFVMGFQYREEAQRFLAALKERFAKFGLEVHEEKTRLIEFGRFAARDRQERGEGKPETFEFLGFTHICAQGRRPGTFWVRRKSAARRVRAKLKEIREELLNRRHLPVVQQGRWLRSVVQGFFNYHAVPGNGKLLDVMRNQINRAWLRALRRRSQKSGRLSWTKVQRLAATWVPRAKILHPFPNQRLRVRYSR